jgi:hypothetical protein
MRSKGRGAEPARFAAVRQRFEQWRATRLGRGRIPERLWMSAVKLAGVYGLCRTARTLGLDYNALKKRVESAGLNTSPAEPRPKRKIRTRGSPVAGNLRSTPRVSKPRHQNPGTTFIELPALDRSVTPECTIELEHPRGAKMRVRLAGCQSPEVVAALSRVFLGAES